MEDSNLPPDIIGGICMISIGELYFLLFMPVIGLVLGIIIALIYSSKNGSGSYRGSSHYNNYSSFESEMRTHNARVEQMMMEQENRRITEEMHRQTHETEGSLAEKFDGRLTNIFRNPWEGIL